jgi:hypothetical protein
MLDTRYLYQCKHCAKKFTKEVHFMRHECTQMKRSVEVQTAIGQQAYVMYKTWLEKQRKKPPAIEGFVSSTFYSSFVKFAHYCRDHAINQNVDVYIELMAKQGISPALWSRPECYNQYVAYLDKKADPYKLGEQTIETLLELADRLKVEPSKIFEELKYAEVLTLLDQRRISPWFLFCSTGFKAWVSKLDSHERDQLYKQVGIGYWADALERKPAVVKDMKMLAQELGL